jgi:2-keto-4-pentenoate hydratase/2-oxohepta-3-ene-1,7-dioic acid hydratase in catechol pathway
LFIRHCKSDKQRPIVMLPGIQGGDILFTGLLSGSAAVRGGRFLQHSDRIHAEIKSIGSMDVTMKRS